MARLVDFDDCNAPVSRDFVLQNGMFRRFDNLENICESLKIDENNIIYIYIIILYRYVYAKIDYTVLHVDILFEAKCYRVTFRNRNLLFCVSIIMKVLQ